MAGHRSKGPDAREIELKSHGEVEPNIPWTLILRGLDGVTVATKAVGGESERIAQVLQTATLAQRNSDISATGVVEHDDEIAQTLYKWLIAAKTLEGTTHHRANLAIVLAYLLQSGRHNVEADEADLDLVWSIVQNALADVSVSYTVSRSAQGFLAIPLWSVIKDGNIEELFRLHVWLPDGKRGIPDFAIHAHQPFAEGWILTGQGKIILLKASLQILAVPHMLSTPLAGVIVMVWNAARTTRSIKNRLLWLIPVS